MSELLSEFELFGNCDFKNDIKYYHVWNYGYGKQHKSALFVTNDDKVYVIDIDERIMTSSYRSVIEKHRYNGDLIKFKPIEIKELSDKKIKEFHICYDFVLALSEENKLYSWGWNKYGQLGRESEGDIDKRNPKEIIYFTNSISNIKQICVHWRTVMVLLDNGKVVVWGENEIKWPTEYSRFSNNGFIIIEPFELYSLKEIEFIHMTYLGCFAIDRNYNVFTWGDNEYGELGHESTLSFISEPKFSGILSKLKIITIKGDWNVTYLLSSDGKLYICGWGCESIETVNNSLNLIQLKEINNRIVVLSDEEKVYEMGKKEMEETIYKSFEEYSRLKFEITFKTETLRLKDFKMDLTELIGHGGFGRVYKVLFQQHFYAVKKILINEDTKNYLDNNNELKIMRQLKSDFVVNLYDYWIKNENDFQFLYIQMELCDQTLKDIIIEEKNVSIPPIIDYMIRTEIFRQLLFALNYLHSMTPKVIHRDIKPLNVLIKYHDDHAQCKLCDFGLAKILEKESSNTNVGTSRYRAPEVSTNKYNEKIDIFSLGISIRELFDYLMVVETNEYNLSRNLENLNNIIITMIHGSPDQRPSAEELLNKIRKFSIDMNKRIELFTLIDKVRNENDYLPLKFLKLDLKSNNNCTVS